MNRCGFSANRVIFAGLVKHQEVSDDWKEKTHKIAQKTLTGQLVQ